MLVEQFQIGPSIVDMFGWGGPLATGTHGIEAPGIKGQRRFEANITLPVGVIVVDVSEALALLEAKRVECDVPRVGAIASIVFAKNVEMVEVFVTPLETELEHKVQLGQRGVTSDKESTPDKWTDASQDDTQLIDVWMGLLLFHAQSVRRHTPCFKGSPRYLAVSLFGGEQRIVGVFTGGVWKGHSAP